MEEGGSICPVCVKQFSIYTCPRCNMRYCSLPCYKSHSLRCTESFMRHNVLSNLQNVQVSSQTKKKMLQTLKHSYEEDLSSAPLNALQEEGNNDGDEDEDEDEDGEDRGILSEETLQKLLHGKDITFEGLSRQEQKDFLRAVKAGKVSHMIQPWDPWWLHATAKNLSLSKQGTRLIETVETNHEEPSFVPVDPSVIPLPPQKPLIPLKNLTSVQPSPLLSVHLVEILYSYCFTLRLLNGDWMSDPSDAAEVIMDISRVLRQATSPESVSEALLGCFETTCSPCYRHVGGYGLGLTICDDVVSLLQIGKPAVICALADSQRMLESAASCFRHPEKKSGVTTASKDYKNNHAGNRISNRSSKMLVGRRQDRIDLKLVVNKLKFFMSWANECDGELFQTLAILVGQERNRLCESRCNQNSSFKVNTLEEEHKIKPMVEEIGLWAEF